MEPSKISWPYHKACSDECAVIWLRSKAFFDAQIALHYLGVYAAFFWIYFAATGIWVYSALSFESDLSLATYAALPVLMTLSFYFMWVSTPNISCFIYWACTFSFKIWHWALSSRIYVQSTTFFELKRNNVNLTNSCTRILNLRTVSDQCIVVLRHLVALLRERAFGKDGSERPSLEKLL